MGQFQLLALFFMSLIAAIKVPLFAIVTLASFIAILVYPFVKHPHR